MPHLYDIFRNQTSAEKELIVLDDSATPSEFMRSLADERVDYVHTNHRLPLGAKRDMLASRARGEVVVHMDDDDYYAPEYGSALEDALDGSDFVKLTGWFSFHVMSTSFFYWDSLSLDRIHYRVATDVSTVTSLGELSEDERRQWRLSQGWGYGFSYAFRKSIYTRARFRWQDVYAEDFRFFEAVRRSGARIVGVSDRRGLALHVIHGTNSSFVLPNYHLPSFLLPRLFGGAGSAFLAAAHGVFLPQNDAVTTPFQPI